MHRATQSWLRSKQSGRGWRSSARALLVALAVPLAAAAAPADNDTSALPELLYYVAPVYPRVHLLASGELILTCQVTIGASGSVLAVVCPRGSDPDFAGAAVEAWKQSKFAPPQSHGVVRPITVGLPMQFALQTSGDEPAAPASLQLPAPVALEGEVLEAGERKPLAGADVIAEGLGISTTTDQRGRFHLLLPPGVHQICANRGDFKPTVGMVELSAGSPAPRLTLSPFHRQGALFEATVRQRKEKTEAASESDVSHEELRNVPGTNNDPLRVIEDLPGVAHAPFSGGQLIVRGAQPQDTGAFVDGQKIPILYHLLNGPSVLSEDMVERIDFLPGGAGVYFGGQLAGIVDVIPRVGDPDHLHGSLAVDLNKSSGFLRGPLGDSIEFAAGARVSYVNPLYTTTARPDQTYQVPLYWDYQTRFDIKLPDASHLTVSAFGSGDSFDQINPGRGNAVATSEQDVHFHRFQLHWDKQLASNLTLTVAPQFGVGSDLTATSGTGAGAFSLPSQTSDQSIQGGLRSSLTLKLPGESQIRAGIDATAERVDYVVDEQVPLSLTGVQSGTDAEPVNAVGAQHFATLGLYTEGSFQIGPVRLTPGLRLEVMHWTGQSYAMFDPRIWARYQLTPELQLFAYAGIYHQAPQAAQLDPTVGNPALVPERATQGGVGSQYLAGSDWTFRIEGFLQRRSSLPFNGTPSLNPDGSVYYPLLVNSGIGRSMGVEILIRRELTSKLYGWIAYTLSRSQQLERPGFPWEPTDYDQPHVLTTLIAYRRNDKAEISARFRFASGNPIREISGSALNADSGNYLPFQSAFGANRLPPFVQFDLQVNNVWNAESFRLSMYLEFQNIFGRNNPEGIVYNFNDTQQAYVPGQPLNISIGVKASF